MSVLLWTCAPAILLLGTAAGYGAEAHPALRCATVFRSQL